MGNFLGKVAPDSALSQDIYPPSSKFDPERDIPDLTGKVVLVTGGNAGIGYHTVRLLLLKNAKVYLAARSANKAARAIEQLAAETGGRKAVFLELDLADLKSVRRAAETFLENEGSLDVLFNNGGVMVPPLDQFTAQGYDLQFGTNVIGHYFLTDLLLPALAASHASTGIPARVIHTSSSAHKRSGTRIDFQPLKGGPDRDAWLKKLNKTTAAWRLYGESKRGNILVSNYFAKAHADILVSCALHPGSVRTDLQKHMSGFVQWLLDLALPKAEMGAYTQLWAGTTASPAQITGQYLFPWARIGTTDPVATNSELENELITYLKAQVEEY